ncbi:hypothetical protein ISCGN_033164 [Ixodes scapularis]
MEKESEIAPQRRRRAAKLNSDPAVVARQLAVERRKTEQKKAKRAAETPEQREERLVKRRRQEAERRARPSQQQQQQDAVDVVKNQRCKGRRRANATDDDRATEAKRKREARRRLHSTSAEQFPGATARFRREFVENPFGVTCAVCDRLCVAGDNQRCKGRRRANATDDDRATEAKRKREARRRLHSTSAEQFPGATARFRREFVQNPFGVTCAVCDRLCVAGDNQRCKGRRRANATDDDRATEAKRKREARRRLHSTSAEQFPGATARFRREFVENPFGVTCAVCDRLCVAGDVSTIGGVSDEKKREAGACALRQCIEYSSAGLPSSREWKG